MKKHSIFVLAFGFAWACASGNDPEEVKKQLDSSDPADGGEGGALPPGVDPPPEKVTDFASFCRARAKRECTDDIARACGAASTSACADKRNVTCIAAIPQGTELRLDQVQACLDAVTAAHADTTVTPDEIAAVKKACDDSIFSGPGAARAPCKSRYDCSTKDGLDCLIPRNTTSGSCLKPVPVSPGGPCPGEADVCADGYFCQPTSKQCVAFAQQGEQCNPDNMPCAPKLQPCVNGGPFGASCQAKRNEGLPCKEDADCTDNLCDKLENVPDGNCAIEVELSSLDSMCSTYR
jgi:hypothetical protein